MTSKTKRATQIGERREATKLMDEIELSSGNGPFEKRSGGLAAAKKSGFQDRANKLEDRGIDQFQLEKSHLIDGRDSERYSVPSERG
jgi:hypothetical protein